MNISGILRGWTGLAVGSHFAGAMAIVDSAGNQISTFGGGTQYTEDAVAATDPVGTVPILVRTDTPTTAQVSANGDNIAQRGSNFGAAYTTLLDSAGNYASIGGGTQYANGSAQATPTGTTALGWDGANVRALSTTTTGALNTVMAGVSTPADGAANPTNTAPVSAYLLSYNGTTWDRARSSTDACDGGSKVFVAISQITSTQLLTGTASNKTHVCSLTIVQPAASTQTYSVVSGTGTVCATGAAAVLGGTTAATGLQQPIAFGSGAGTIAKSAVNADNVCLLQSGTDRLTGVLGYVVAP